MGIWQIIYVGLLMMSLGTNLAKHGEPRTGKHSFWVSLVAIGIEFVILYNGGFFS